MKRSEIAAQLQAEYDKKRAARQDERDRRAGEVIARCPEAEALINAPSDLLRKAAKALLTSPEAARAQAQTLAETARRADAALKKALSGLGYPADYLDIPFDCPICRDRGYVDAPYRQECQCFRQEVARRMRQAASDKVGTVQTFERFDENILPDEGPVIQGRSQRAQTMLVRAACERYADEYPHTPTPGLVLMGTSGLGKTFLLNAVDARLSERGVEAERVTAFSLFEAMRGYHFGQEAQKARFERLLTCDMLLIDDLGTEPMMQNITVEYLFTLLNERSVNRRHTMIATNLMPNDVLARYGERVYSRLMDSQSMTVYPLAGRDLRRR